MKSYSRVMPKVVSALGARVAIGLCLALGGGASAAYAQQCSCTAPLASQGQVVGQITAASGTVNVLGAGGWTTGRVGTPLSVGSRIETGSSSSTSFTVGSCSMSLGPQSSANVEAANQALCVVLNDTRPNVGAIVAVGVGLGAAAGIVAVATSDDKPASQ